MQRRCVKLKCMEAHLWQIVNSVTECVSRRYNIPSPGNANNTRNVRHHKIKFTFLVLDCVVLSKCETTEQNIYYILFSCRYFSVTSFGIFCQLCNKFISPRYSFYTVTV